MIMPSSQLNSYPSEWFKGGTSGVIKPNRDLSDQDKKLLGDLYGGPRGPFKTSTFGTIQRF